MTYENEEFWRKFHLKEKINSIGEVIYGISAILGVALAIIGFVFRVPWIVIVAAVFLLVAMWTMALCNYWVNIW